MSGAGAAGNDAVGALAALGSALVLGAAGYLAFLPPVRARARAASPGSSRAGGDAHPFATARLGPVGVLARAVAWVGRGGWRRRRTGPADLGMVCTRVASRLRSGASARDAWSLELAGLRGDPTGADEPGVPRELLALAGSSEAVAAAIAACRVAARSGAPLADVLDACAAAIAETEAAEQDRRRARAGPAATARLLGWLPVGSLLLGMMLGADPVAAALDGGWGTLSILGGMVLLVLGHVWSVRLVARAAAPGGVEG